MRPTYIALLCVVAHPSVYGGPAHSGFMTQEGAGATFIHPAGLTALKQPEFSAQVVVAPSRSTFEVESNSGQEDGSSTSDDILVIPSVYYAAPLTGKWAYGLAVNVPGGFGGDYGDDSVTRYLITDWNLVYIGFTGALAYAINDKWSVGFGVNGTYVSYELNSAVFNPEPGMGDGEMQFEADDIGVGFTISAEYRWTERTRFSVTYQSEISSTVSGSPDFSGLGPTRQQIADNHELGSRDVDIDTTMPQRLLFGVRHDFDNGWYWQSDAAWIDFSAFGVSRLAIGSNSVTPTASRYQDIYLITGALMMPVNNRLTWGVGALYASSAVDDEDRSLLLRLDRIYGIGASLDYRRDRDSFGLALNYFDLGSAPVTADVADNGVGITGEFESNYAVTLDLTYTRTF